MTGRLRASPEPVTTEHLPEQMADAIRSHHTDDERVDWEGNPVYCVCGEMVEDWEDHWAAAALSVRWEAFIATAAENAQLRAERDHAEGELSALRDHNTRWETEKARADAAEAEVRHLSAFRDELFGDIAKTVAERDRAKSLVGAAGDQIGDVIRERNQAQAVVERLRAELAQAHNLSNIRAKLLREAWDAHHDTMDERDALRRKLTAKEAEVSGLNRDREGWRTRADKAEAELAVIKRVTDPPTDEEMPADPAELREMWEFVNRQARWQWHMAHKFGDQVERLRAELAEREQDLRTEQAEASLQVTRLTGRAERAEAERDALKAAIERAEAKHRTPAERGDPTHPNCSCGLHSPCPTRRALAVPESSKDTPKPAPVPFNPHWPPLGTTPDAPKGGED
jgi:uncharacterized coiled-coil DUF342 family protein